MQPNATPTTYLLNSSYKWIGDFGKVEPTYKLQPLNGVHIADDGLVELPHSVNLLLFIHLQKSDFEELFLCNRTWVMFA